MSAGTGVGYAAVAEYLFNQKPRGSKFGIDRMRPFAALLGHPERAVPWIHIAGTNGKGSVAAMVDSILRTAGYKVGLFTSPHLVHLGERVQVNRSSLSEQKIIDYVRELDPVADRVAGLSSSDDRPSFFEFMTAMALLEFQRTQCDVGVIEVGLGGEFDATNIINPEVSVIASIGLDHCDLLGHSLEEIARAKAGIIKNNRPLVIGRLPAAAEKVVRSIAHDRGARVVSVRENFGESIANYPETNLAGDYQRWNAATATLTVGELNSTWRIPMPALAQGLRSVDWPGRWQRLRVGERNVILDSSHNAEGATVLDANLAALIGEFRQQPVVVVGALGGERASALIDVIAKYASEIHLVVPNQPRATTHNELESLIRPEFAASIFRSSITQIFPGGPQCTVGRRDEVVVVTGSIYLLGEVMTQLKKSPADAR
jgi:dihydrofolate synthase/folylpolyglutamate synthase